MELYTTSVLQEIHFMKLLILVPGLLFACCASPQVDSAEEYRTRIYNTETLSVNTSYNYSNKWDLDGDGKNDSLYLIGNGGAHVYYYLRVKLSLEKVTREFTSIQLDLPYVQELESLNELGKTPAVQLVVNDFDKDGIVDLYLNFDNPFGKIPTLLRQKGIRSKYIILGFPGGKMKVRDY